MPQEQRAEGAATSLQAAVERAVAARYAESGAERYGMDRERFCALVGAVLERAGGASASDQLQVLKTLHVDELALARACTAGSEAAWTEFLGRYRSGLYAAARGMTRDETAGRELADELYAELWGVAEREGKRISKLDYYTGRGSLAGWLRTVLAQRHVDGARRQARNVSLEEQMEAGAHFAAAPEANATEPDAKMARAVEGALAEAASEDRVLLAAYFLDRRTLAEMGRMLGVHESTVSRRLERAAAAVRKRVRKRLTAEGFAARRLDELLDEVDVRDLRVEIAGSLKQETRDETI